MHAMLFLLSGLFALATASPAARYRSSQPFAGYLQTRDEAGSVGAGDNTTSSLQVDLGYSVYRGYTNTSSGINIFKGIRFAQPPTGNLRWQAPRAPIVNRTQVLPAQNYSAQCPQSPPAIPVLSATTDNTASSEDCLFLNVWTPSIAKTPLPVLVWIHGGGYGLGNGQNDLQAIMTTNNNSFVGVTIQYRLGAFGFMSSDEIYRKGVVNAGILDQHFALQWVQQYIHLFNGDSRKVTIAGESAGGGAVMLQDMAYGGSLGTQLFQNTISASPYLPMQYGYKDWIPSQSYYSLAARVGCDTMLAYGANGTQPTFECLLNVSSSDMINASATISQSGTYGTWGFLPVTDGIFIQDQPSRQLNRRQVNGANALVGNNANEGTLFVPQNIDTEDDLLAWLRLTFPLFSNNDIAKILYYYPSSNSSTDPNATLFATSGDAGPTAINQSSVGTGQQQRANTIYAETTFVCPSYWQVEAYSNNALGGQGYKYQFSIPPALHGNDVAAYLSWPGTDPFSVDFATAFQSIWGAFITTGNPSISTQIANGASAMDGTYGMPNPASTWPPYTIYNPVQIDLNTTCGASATQDQLQGLGLDIPSCSDPRNVITLVDAYTWEGGRGTRCDFWRAMGELVPE